MAKAPNSLNRFKKGEKALCIASGPSLLQEDIDYCKNKFDIVITINDAWRKAVWADYLYACDRLWWNYYDGVPEFRGAKFSLQGTEFKDVYALTNTGTYGVDFKWPNIRTGKNGGHQAINLAIHLSAKQIVLLGFDCKSNENKSHYFGEHPKEIKRSMPYKDWVYAYRKMKEDLSKTDIEIINCTRDSAIDAFPNLKIIEVA